MFSQASVILFMGASTSYPLGQTPPWADTPLSRHPLSRQSLWADTPWADTPSGQTPPGQTPLPGQTPPGQTFPGGHCSGWYASYWNAFLLKFHSDNLDKAFKAACMEGTQEVFLACMNFVGHREAGKTSLANRLMGKEFEEDTQSTEGVAIHRIKSTINKFDLKGAEWKEDRLDPDQLFKNFSHAILSLSVQLNKADEERKKEEIQRKFAEISSPLKTEKPETKPEPSRQQEDHLGTLTGFKARSEASSQKITSGISKSFKLGPSVHEAEDDQEEKRDTKIGPAAANYPVPVTEGIDEVRRKLTPTHAEDKPPEPRESKKEIEIPTLGSEMKKAILSHKTSIAQEESSSTMPFSLVLWDLGGQNEFIETHHLFLDVAATTLVVMDITKGLHHHLEEKPKLGHPNTPAEVLRYWLNTIHSQAFEKNVKPNIALVLTHKDMVQTLDRNQYIEKYIQCVEKYIEGKSYAGYLTRNNIFVVDNKTGDDADFSHLRNELIHHLANQKSWRFEMPIPWHKLKADVIKRAQKAGKKYLSLTEVVSMATEYGMNKKKVDGFLKVQNSLGEFIHYSSPNLQEIVITDPQWLVDMCKALITHPSFLNTRNLTSSVLNKLKQGQVTGAGLQELWKGEAVDFSKEFLIKFKLIVPLNFTKAEGRRYLIPSMLPSIDVDMYEREPFKSMYLVYNALQNPMLGDTLLIGTFHKLLADCSQTETGNSVLKIICHTLMLPSKSTKE